MLNWFSLCNLFHALICLSATCISKYGKGSSKHDLECEKSLQEVSLSCGVTDKEVELIGSCMCCTELILFKLSLKRINICDPKSFSEN